MLYGILPTIYGLHIFGCKIQHSERQELNLSELAAVSLVGHYCRGPSTGELSEWSDWPTLTLKLET